MEKYSFFLLLLAILVLFYLPVLNSQCNNYCNQHGQCNVYGICECYQGWDGFDCSRRTCPLGPNVADIAYTTDMAHQSAVCSGRGTCDSNTGLCKCAYGFSGNNCGRLGCANECSNHGQCISLKAAAELNSGHIFNRTTSYNRWDGNVFYGCVCDAGYSGYDCSERICLSGIDPRLNIDTLPYEKVTFVCNCESSNCVGKFKFQYYGSGLQLWLSPSSTMLELEKALHMIPFMASNDDIYALPYNGSTTSINTLTNQEKNKIYICNNGHTVKTNIFIKKNSLELPSLAVYINAMTSGSVYFETIYKVKCSCLFSSCSGSFRLSYDGQISSSIDITDSVNIIVDQLRSMSTIFSSEVTVYDITTSDMIATGRICDTGKVSNYTLYLHSPRGSLPHIKLFSSILYNSSSSGSSSSSLYLNQIDDNNLNHQTYLNDIYFNYNSNNTNRSEILTISAQDDRSKTVADSIKLCNGVGKCIFQTGVCECPFGYGPDDILGPCGAILVNSSKWGGLSRCPGVVDRYSNEDGADSDKGWQLNERRVYISFNPSDEFLKINTTTNVSYIESFLYNDQTPVLDTTSNKLYLRLSSNSSAGPMLIDHARDEMFFIDANPINRFIAKASIYSMIINNTHTSLSYKWLALNEPVYGFAMDTTSNHRKIYWSSTGTSYLSDGIIFVANMDDDASIVVAISLVASIGQHLLMDPMGLAVDYLNQRLVWVDRLFEIGSRSSSSSSSSSYKTCLRSCALDGTDAKTLITYDNNGHNTTDKIDLLIDKFHNNTAYFIQSERKLTGAGSSIVATTLDFLFKNSTFLNWTKFPTFAVNYGINIVNERKEFNNDNLTIIDASYIAIDLNFSILYWTDQTSRQLKYLRYGNDYPGVRFPSDNSGIAYTAPIITNTTTSTSFVTYIPIGVVFDDGFGIPQWNRENPIDCYGNGVCSGFTGNYICQCHEGFYGDCQARVCPSGLAWFHEPVIDESAHDVMMECSNMGICDRLRGTCNCKDGFEGSACERLSCPQNTMTGMMCSGSGSCHTMREMAKFHTDEYLSPQPLDYGSLPNNPITWDADAIQGCIADSYGYTEHGNINITSPKIDSIVSNVFECPYGYNMRLLDNITNGISNYSHFLRETQSFSCNARRGIFQLEFRGELSMNISYDNTLQDLHTALQNLPTLGLIQLSSSLGNNSTNPICVHGDYQYINITFISNLGKLPLLIPHIYNFRRSDYVQIGKVIEGQTNGFFSCCGKGECNSDTGICECWTRYSSSDGFGNIGLRGDCGHNNIE